MQKLHVVRPLPTLLLATGSFALLVAAGCGSDEAAKKDDPPPTAEPAPAEEPAAEEPAAEEPAAEPEPAEPPPPDMSVYEGAARITAAKTKSGKAGLRVTKVTPDGGYARCGLQDDDIVLTIDGAAAPGGREGVDALNLACAHGKPVVVDRKGTETTLGGGA